MPSSPVVNGLSVDVEDWFQVGAFEGVIDRESWDSQSDRVVGNCERIPVSYTHLRAHATVLDLVCRLLLGK